MAHATADSATYAVTAMGCSLSSSPVEWYSDANGTTTAAAPAGVTASYSAGTLTVTTAASAAPGNYYFRVYSGSTYSAVAQLTIDKAALTAPANPTFNEQTGEASWDAVANATDYNVQLYKGLATVGSAQTVSGTSYDFKSDMISSEGLYTFKVTALGDTNFSDSAETESGGVAVYKVQLGALSGDEGNDAASMSAAYLLLDETASISYTLDNTANVNALTLTNMSSITTAGTGTASYTVNGAHATAYVITITPTFSHENNPAIDLLTIGGVTPPVAGALPVSTITETAQYTGTVTWTPNDNPFDYNKQYAATITLSPKAGYTLTGVTANSFTVAHTVSVIHSADSGVITAVFPPTGVTPGITDTIPPAVLLTTPSGPGIELNGGLVITFDEAIGTTGTVELNSAPLAGGTWSAGNTVYTVPYSGLNWNTFYVISISGFKDIAGNEMVLDTSYSFTTRTEPAGPDISPPTLDILTGSTGTITVYWGQIGNDCTDATVGSDNAAVATPTSSSIGSLATIVTVDGLSAGTATITLGFSGGTHNGGAGATKTVTVNVSDPPGAEYPVIVQNDGNGTGSAGPNPAKVNDMVTLSALPNPGFQFKEWQVVSPAGQSITGNQFSMPAEPVRVRALFETHSVFTYTLTVTAGNGGSVLGTQSGNYAQGTPISVSAIPDMNYTFIGWTENGVLVSADNSYTFALTGNRNLVANFEYVGDGNNENTGGSGSGGWGSGDNSSYTPPATIDMTKSPNLPTDAQMTLSQAPDKNNTLNYTITKEMRLIGSRPAWDVKISFKKDSTACGITSLGKGFITLGMRYSPIPAYWNHTPMGRYFCLRPLTIFP